MAENITLSCDLETYSEIDIGKCGSYKYVDDPSFEILLIGYSIDAAKTVKVIDLTSNYNEEDLDEFLRYLKDPAVKKTAFNAQFEMTCLAKYFNLEIKPEEWYCTAVHASMLGLPRSLGGVCEAIGLPQDKAKDRAGKALINYFCKPCKPTKVNGGRTRNLPEHAPDKWQQFIEYNAQDVRAEQAVLDRISFYKIQDMDRRLWVQDANLNRRGVLVDVNMIENIVRYDAIVKERLLNESKEITGLDNPNSPSQLKQWLEGRGITIDKLSKETIPDIIENTDDQTVKRVLGIRLALSKTSTKKFEVMLKARCHDDRVRGLMVLYGANRTGRWTSRLIQLQNMSKNYMGDIDDARYLCCEGEMEMLETLYGEPSSVFSELVRTSFIASPGNRFVIADFSAIEARVISWVAGEEWRMEVFRTHGKIYEAAASQMFHVPIESIKKGSKLRQQGKVAELACGYQGGVGALRRMDPKETIPDEELPEILKTWRNANPHIVKLWDTVEKAAKTAIKQHRIVKIQHDISFSYEHHILFVQLPSGRKLSYYDARLENIEGKETITYAGTNQISKKWSRISTYGGKLVENIIQAIARDCLAVTMIRLEDKGYNVVFHIHDEVIIDAPKEDKDALKTVLDIFSEPISWAPGLYLKGDGYESPYYLKD